MNPCAPGPAAEASLELRAGDGSEPMYREGPKWTTRLIANQAAAAPDLFVTTECQSWEIFDRLCGFNPGFAVSGAVLPLMQGGVGQGEVGNKTAGAELLFGVQAMMTGAKRLAHRVAQHGK